ncbi:hypothetical protein B296_00000940 [Ensete ventricosum]|uniref:Uncharacterized protein n=1 Tax=Ensete ventricosum TaxID=4639 RepID=A0A427ANS0_ENSVE|nr:hypothetical protein B296_00000940 [Ensete ventricosum]
MTTTTTGPRDGRGIDLVASLSHGFYSHERRRRRREIDQGRGPAYVGRPPWLLFLSANFVDSLMRRGFEFHMNWLLEGLQYALGRTTLGSPPPPPPPPLSLLREDHDEGEAGGALSEDFLSPKLMVNGRPSSPRCGSLVG